MVLDLTSCKKVDTELLQKITEELEKRAGDSGSQTEDAHLDSTGESWKSRETEQLVDTLGKLLQLVYITCYLSQSNLPPVSLCPILHHEQKMVNQSFQNQKHYHTSSSGF